LGAGDEGAEVFAVRRADGVDGGEGLCECLLFVGSRGQFCWHGGAVQGGK
jgi:hypothetical protein